MEYPKLPLSPASHRQTSQSLRLQRGMTLVEWMISITIGLVLLAGLTALIAQQSSTQVELEKSSRQIENGRYAMQILNEDVQMAGYYGEFSKVGVATPASFDPCLKDPAVMEALMVFPVQGYDVPNAGTVPSCIDAANYLAGTDILVIRRVEPATVTIAAAASAAGGQSYLQSGLTPSGMEFSKKLGKGSDTSVFTLFTKDGATPALLRKYLVHIYFVSPCSVPTSGSTCSTANTDDGGASIPTLKRLELTAAAGTTQFVTTSLVEGIEKLQIDYGFDTTDDGAPDNYAKDAAAVADWAQVMTLRVHLLARNNERTVGYQDTKTYNLGLHGTTAATNDGFKRRVFSQLIRVVNPSSRRDS